MWQVHSRSNRAKPERHRCSWHQRNMRSQRVYTARTALHEQLVKACTATGQRAYASSQKKMLIPDRNAITHKMRFLNWWSAKWRVTNSGACQWRYWIAKLLVIGAENNGMIMSWRQVALACHCDEFHHLPCHNVEIQRLETETGQLWKVHLMSKWLLTPRYSAYGTVHVSTRNSRSLHVHM